MMNFDNALIATIVVGIIGMLLTIVRRFGNKDKEAGSGVAGWTLFIIILIWVRFFNI